MTPALLIALSIFASTPPAGPYSVVRDRVTVQKTVWPLFCDEAGAKSDAQTPAGTKLNVVVEGAEWTASGAGRKFGTKSCEGENPTLAVVKRGRKGESIVLECRSRRVTRGTEETKHVVVGTEAGRIELTTTAERYFRKNGDDCRMKVKRTTVATFAGEAPKEAPKVAEAPPADPCATPGAATKLVVSPKVFDLKVGKKARCLEVRATDANGCSVKPAGLSFVLDPADRGSVTAAGCVSPSTSVSEEEAVAILVRMAGLEAVATARLIPKALARPVQSYSALAKTTRSAKARAVLGEVTRGEIVLRPMETDPPPLEELQDEGFPVLPVAGAGAAALLVSFLGLFLAIRRKMSTVVATELEAKPVVTPKKGGGLVCPQCKFEFAVGDATTCPFDDTELVALERDARQTMFIPAAGGMVCPVCQTKYPTKARFCGHDRSPLLPDYGQFDEGGD